MAPKTSQGYDATDAPEVEEAPVLEQTVASDVASSDVEDAHSDTETEGSEKQDDDRSVDGPNRDDDHHDDDDDAPDPTAQSSNPSPVIVLSPADGDETSLDEFTQEQMALMQDMDYENLKKLREHLKKKASVYVSALKLVVKSIKKADNVSKKEATAIRKKERDEQKKVEKREVSFSQITLNININGVSSPLVVRGNHTIGRVRELIGENILTSLAKNKVKQGSLRYGEIFLSDHPRATVKSFKLKDGDTLFFTAKGRGGGSKRRATSSSKESISVVLRPKPLEKDPPQVVNVLKLGESINLPAWINSLSKEQLHDLVEQMDGAIKTGNLGSVINSYMSYVNEWNNLEDRKDFFE